MSFLLFHPTTSSLQVEHLAQLGEGVVGRGDGVADGARVLEDLVVVAALVRLVAEEVDRGVVDAARQVLLVRDVLQAVRLVPALREDVEGDLAADGVAGNIGSGDCS